MRCLFYTRDFRLASEFIYNANIRFSPRFDYDFYLSRSFCSARANSIAWTVPSAASPLVYTRGRDNIDTKREVSLS